MKQLTSKEAVNFVNSIEKPFSSLPHLPKGIVDFIVGISHWLAGIGGALGVFGGLNSLLVSGRRGYMWKMIETYSGMSSWYFRLVAIISILSGALLLISFKLLRDKKIDGWMYLFWANILGIAQMLLSILFGYGGLVSSLIGVLIGFYVLFEMKPRYK